VLRVVYEITRHLHWFFLSQAAGATSGGVGESGDWGGAQGVDGPEGAGVSAELDGDVLYAGHGSEVYDGGVEGGSVSDL